MWQSFQTPGCPEHGHSDDHALLPVCGFFPPRHFIQMEASSVFFAAGFFHLVQHFFEKSFQSFVKLSSNLSRVFTVMSRMGCLEESQSS